MEIRVEGAKSSLRATLSRAIASAVVGGFDQAEQEDRPLTLLQRMDMVTMACMAYHDAVIEGEQALDGELLFEQMRTATEEGV